MDPTIRATSKKAALFGALLLVVGTVLIATPSLGQTAEPSISFLNPSSFATAGSRGIIVSDARPDDGPGCCDQAVGRYRLSAWVANAPPGSMVFFSLVQRSVDVEITSTPTPGTNTWEAQWDIPDEVLDGPATLSAYLVVDEEPIAVDSQEVTIMRVQENAQLTYPSPGGRFGTHAALATALTEGATAERKKPMGVIDALYTNTPDMVYVRTFYTTSDPGSDPQWKICGTEAISTSNTSPHNGVRCTLADAGDQDKITAVAAVANDSPDSYDTNFNQSGDAVAIAEPYAQQPTNLAFTSAGSQRVNRDANSRQMPCSTNEVVKLTDQFGRQITAANMDVHATGPSDSLRFHAPLVLSRTLDAPDRGTHSVEAAFDCTSAGGAPPTNAHPDEQGEHQRFGLPDRKHAESLPVGTTDLGTFQFRAHATTEGQTDYTIWVDEADDGCLANDDTFTAGEISVTGSIGWGQEPGFPAAQPTEVMVPCGSVGPSPEPSESPTEEPLDGSRAVSLRISTDPIVIGEPATFAGEIDAAALECATDQRVVLKARRPGQKFWTKHATRTDGEGRFEIVVRVRAPRDYRAVAPAAGGCDRARSVITRVRA